MAQTTHLASFRPIYRLLLLPVLLKPLLPKLLKLLLLKLLLLKLLCCRCCRLGVFVAASW
jgi:hypothetical protein